MEHSTAIKEPALAAEERSRARWRAALTFLCATSLAIAAVEIVRFEVPPERAALRSMRNMLDQSVAPGEVVLVDDRLLGWMLTRGTDETLRQSVWTLGKDVTADSLLPRLERERRREMVVLATPDGDLVRWLDEADFSVAQEVGWVPWDVTGKGYRLMGRGRKRIYFAVAPKSVDAKHEGGKVSSGLK
jgi:hypothetical protein